MKKPSTIQIATLLQVGALASMIAGGITYFETSASAEERYELAATDREVGDLRTRLRLVQIELARFRALARERELTDEERIELRSLEAEREVLLGRLGELGKI